VRLTDGSGDGARGGGGAVGDGSMVCGAGRSSFATSDATSDASPSSVEAGSGPVAAGVLGAGFPGSGPAAAVRTVGTPSKSPPGRIADASRRRSTKTAVSNRRAGGAGGSRSATGVGSAVMASGSNSRGCSSSARFSPFVPVDRSSPRRASTSMKRCERKPPAPPVSPSRSRRMTASAPKSERICGRISSSVRPR
jgi:hypothetical protein